MMKKLIDQLKTLGATFGSVKDKVSWGKASSLHRPKKGGKSSLQWNPEKLTRSLFAVESRGTINRGFLLALAAGTSYTVGKIFSILLAGQDLPERPTPLTIQVEDTQILTQKLLAVKSKNLFKTAEPDALGKSAKPTIDKNIICKKSSSPSPLPIKLLNTIVLQDSSKSLAAVQLRGEAELKNFREGDKIDEMAEIGKIDRLNIVIKNLQTGQCEKVANNVLEGQSRGMPLTILSPEDGKKVIAANKMEGINQEGNRITISKKLLNEKLGDMENVLTQARAIQVQNPDGTMAFKIVEIIPGSIFSFLGIQDGDNITQINGKKIMGLNDVMNLLGNIQSVDNLQITVVKDDGQEQGLEYEFVR